MASEIETTAHAAAEAAHGGGEAVGMPQLDFSTFPNQIFWLAVTLVVLYLILSRLALPRIASVLAERAGTITGDLEKAEELKRKAEEAEQAYQKALADARAEAQRVIAEAKAELQREIDEATARADAEIAARAAESEKAIAEIRASALDAVRKVAADVAQEVIVALGGKPDAKAIREAVDARLEG
ncbi:MAG: F0F1 ATP synthase subunit B' [Alphaproteobacteria bacterium]|nr:MAG: F0F1 ATP synthase subunit B' [Alphaproteobacteria bacterium]